MTANLVLARLTAHDVLGYLVVVGLGIGAAEMARQVERRRRRFADTPHVNFSSVWTLAAALVLPGILAAAVVVALYLHLWLRSWRGVAGVYAHRTLFSACNAILSCQLAAWCARSLHVLPTDQDRGAWTALGLSAVILVYFLANSTVVATVIALSKPTWTAKLLIGRLNENLLELATLCMGTLAAMLIVLRPWLVVLIFVPLYALHRSALVRQFEHAATRDSKTGLLNAASWRALAESELRRARNLGTSLGILLIDIDHFKLVNTVHGHLIGDDALQAAGAAIRDLVRGSDLCGRFGGDEFVVMLPGSDAAGVLAVAHRIRERIANAEIAPTTDSPLQVTVSIGVAAFPAAGPDLDDVLLAADNALFAAKDSGRNRVQASEAM
ncbi:GGDEF domain-containing protein [Amycolatopsis saalfeldensis]|uniref:GGDEF domain-containing protein n=1 Tax=Amycolatopsis saalfeldensis TaxID=394193 RepID=UPI0015A69F08|nr:GGDEF domain-containing protein [Amycolatopsis saalfeldensis]